MNENQEHTQNKESEFHIRGSYYPIGIYLLFLSWGWIIICEIFPNQDKKLNWYMIYRENPEFWMYFLLFALVVMLLLLRFCYTFEMTDTELTKTYIFRKKRLHYSNIEYTFSIPKGRNKDEVSIFFIFEGKSKHVLVNLKSENYSTFKEYCLRRGMP